MVHRQGETIAKEGRGIRTFKEYVGENHIAGVLFDCFLVRNVVALSGERVIERDGSQFANLPKCKHAGQSKKPARTVDLEPSAAMTQVA